MDTLILLVSPAAESHAFFAGLSRELGWWVINAHDFNGFVNLFRTREFAAVVCEDTLPDGDWTDVLEALPGPDAPVLIVTSRLADERLWSEVLHRGGYDVLAQPFDRREVERVMELSRHQYQGRAGARRPGRTAAKRSAVA